MSCDIELHATEGHTEKGSFIITKVDGYSQAPRKPLKNKTRSKARRPVAKVATKPGAKLRKPKGYNPIRMLGDNEEYPTLEEMTTKKKYMDWTDESGHKWVLSHSKEFQDYINTKYAKYELPEGQLIKKTDVRFELSDPFPYQEFIRDYMAYGSPNRGLLINHGLGAGKTRTTIMVCESYRRIGIPVMFFGPAFLKTNFIEELFKWADDDIRLPLNYADLSASKKMAVKSKSIRAINAGYKFVSSNASNVLNQLAKLGIGFPTDYMDERNSEGAKATGRKHGFAKLDYPRRMLIVMEEVHNVNKSFSSLSATTIPKVYNLFENAKDCKFLALSATPIVNRPFELATLFNILRGKVNGQDLFPNNEEGFLPLLGRDELIASRIQGLVSYYRGVRSNRDLFPDLKVEPDNFIKMSKQQWTVHQEMAMMERSIEKDDLRSTRKSYKVGPGGRKRDLGDQPGEKDAGSYRSKTRQACNWIWPEDNPKPPAHFRESFSLLFTDPNIVDLSGLSRVTVEEKLKRLQFVYDAYKLERHFDGEDKPDRDDPVKLEEIIKNKDYYPKWLNFGKYLYGGLNPIEMKVNLVSIEIAKQYVGKRGPSTLSQTERNNMTLPQIKVLVKELSKEKNVKPIKLPESIKSTLTEQGKRQIQYLQHTREENLKIAIDVLLNDPDKYLSDEALGSERYGKTKKMLAIFQQITEGNGAMKIVDGPSTDPVDHVDYAEEVAKEVVKEIAQDDEFVGFGDLFDDDTDDFEDAVERAVETKQLGLEQSGGGADSDCERESNHFPDVDILDNTKDMLAAGDYNDECSSQQSGGGKQTEDSTAIIFEETSDNFLSPLFTDFTGIDFRGRHYRSILHALMAYKIDDYEDDDDNNKIVNKFRDDLAALHNDEDDELINPRSWTNKFFNTDARRRLARKQWNRGKKNSQFLLTEITRTFYDQHPTFKAKLVETNNKNLLYKSNCSWGVKKGSNFYGDMLMELRQEFADAAGVTIGPIADMTQEMAKELGAEVSAGILEKRSKVKLLTNDASKGWMIEHNKLYDRSLLNKKGNKHIVGGPALVYSEFNHGEGIGIFKAILKVRGFEELNPENIKTDKIDSMDFKPRFVVISGDVKMELRQNILDVFNHKLNRHGQLISIVLLTSAGSEGISLFHIQQVIIMEPFWHNTRINQVVGRARRLMSHKYLPIEERVVYVNKYYSVQPSFDMANIADMPDSTTDLYLKKKSKEKDKIVESIMETIRRSAVDCYLNRKQNKLSKPCFQFKEGDRSGMAFSDNIDKDITTSATKVIKVRKALYKAYNHRVPKKDGKSTIETIGKYRVDKDGKPVEMRMISVKTKNGTQILKGYPLYDPEDLKQGRNNPVYYVFVVKDRKGVVKAALVTEVDKKSRK